MMIMMEVLPVCLQYPPIERKILFFAQTCLNKTLLSLEIRKDDPESQAEYFSINRSAVKPAAQNKQEHMNAINGYIKS